MCVATMAYNLRHMTPFPDEPWSVGEGTYEGRPLFVRVNTGANVVRGEPSLRTRVSIAVPIRDPDENGLPDAPELIRLNEIEDAISTALGVGARAVHLLVLTASGVRELVYHTTTPDDVNDAIDRVAERFPDHELQLVMEDDLDWSVYAEFSP